MPELQLHAARGDTRELAPLTREPWRTLRLLLAGVGYEQRRKSAFRVGFVVTEVLRGTAKPAAMVFVYLAMFRSTGAETIRGYTFQDLVQYLVLAAMLSKVGIDERTLDVAEQIFDGYVTKYLVMPAPFRTLVAARWVHAILLQLGLSLLAWTIGMALLPRYWPAPVSALAVAQALTLVIAGSYCFLLVYFMLNALAFWLDVVWSLVVMFRFIGLFVGGYYVPIGIMPDALHAAFSWLFPYWSLFAPIEIFLGRQGTPEFVRGLAILAAWGIGLHVLSVVTWRRGRLRYTGSGM